MSRVKKALEKEKRRKETEYRTLLNTTLREYDSLREHKSFKQIMKNIEDLGVPFRPDDKATLQELEETRQAVKNINDTIDTFIDDEIENNNTRFLNKLGDYFVDQESHEKFLKLKELARQDLDTFTEIEERFAYYLEDEEVYEYLFYNDSSSKDIQTGIVNVMDQVLLDLGVNLTDMEKKQNKRWDLNYYE